ncbi:MAG: hypothetical protein KatS3mg102_1168 [Planctomycetota bacterium]|nr:MAG: hypothetical protein KatS3mg102_1168 [Planctomycetota bacterium]
MRRLRDKVVAITGAAGGIGSALARRLGREGARLALLDLDLGAARALAAELRAGGSEALALGCDVTSEEQCERAFATLAAELGGPDVLVNNAGLTALGPFAETEPQVWRRVLEVNLMGSVLCTRAALGALRARRGWIVVISSVAGFAPLVGRAAYAASKHALHGAFATLRAELAAEGVGVTLVCPSYIDTPILSRALDARGQPLGGSPTLAGRRMAPAVLAEAIVRGLVAERALVLPGWTSRAAWWLSRLAPGLYERLMRRHEREHRRWAEGARPAGAPARAEGAGGPAGRAAP